MGQRVIRIQQILLILSFCPPTAYCLPPTMLPIVEQIALKIVARLETITIAGGYHQTVAGVVRPTRLGGFSPEHHLIVVEQADPERPPAPETEGNVLLKEWLQPWWIKLFVRPSDTDLTPVDAWVNIFLADCIKALTAPASWHTWDGLAINSYYRDPVGFVTEKGDHEGAMLPLYVHYRHPEDDPFAVG